MCACQLVLAALRFYPLYPPPPGTCLDLTGDAALQLQQLPDLLLLPSDLAPFAKLVAAPPASQAGGGYVPLPHAGAAGEGAAGEDAFLKASQSAVTWPYSQPAFPPRPIAFTPPVHHHRLPAGPVCGQPWQVGKGQQRWHVRLRDAGGGCWQGVAAVPG
jgi:hypothetical protein